MSFVRDMEDRLRKSEGINTNIEQEIPFWEFLDIEFNRDEKLFRFVAYYKQKPTFSELFKRFIESPILHKIDDELDKKLPFRIYKSRWRSRAELDFEVGANNVLYTLIDTKSKLVYFGEAANLVARLRQDHPSIPNWNYFRYDTLPSQMAKHRRAFERMIITDYAFLLKSKSTIRNIAISDYELVNDKIDSR